MKPDKLPRATLRYAWAQRQCRANGAVAHGNCDDVECPRNDGTSMRLPHFVFGVLWFLLFFFSFFLLWVFLCARRLRGALGWRPADRSIEVRGSIITQAVRTFFKNGVVPRQILPDMLHNLVTLRSADLWLPQHWGEHVNS